MDVQLFAVGQEVESLIITTGELNRSEQQLKNGSVTEELTFMPEIEHRRGRTPDVHRHFLYLYYFNLY